MRKKLNKTCARVRNLVFFFFLRENNYQTGFFTVQITNCMNIASYSYVFHALFEQY